MIYHRHYHADYDDATRRLSMLEHGAYRRLLDAYYSDERPLPRTRDETYRLAGAFTAEERTAVDVVLATYFTLAPDGCYHNERADEEIAKAQTAQRVAQENGRKGGRPKTRKETHGITAEETPSETIRAVVQPFSRSSTTTAARVREALPELARSAFDTLAGDNPEAVARALQSAHEPITGGPRYTWEQVGQALIDYAANERQGFVARLFKRYLETAARPAPERANGKHAETDDAIAEGVRQLNAMGAHRGE